MANSFVRRVQPVVHLRQRLQQLLGPLTAGPVRPASPQAAQCNQGLTIENTVIALFEVRQLVNREAR